MINILFYNGIWTEELPLNDISFPPEFHITTARTQFQQMDAVVFHMPSLTLDVPLEKPENQLWVFWSMECELHFPYLMEPAIRDMFDIFMTYKTDADVPVPYIEPDMRQRLRQPPAQKTKGICMFVSSRFNQSNRIALIRELMDELPIDSYGSLFRNCTIENDQGISSKMEIIKNYHFTIAFENAISDDYVTEKFFDPLMAGSVPVYLGAPNIHTFAPGANCYINARDYPSTKTLAAHLRALMADQERYQDYLQWKEASFLPAFETRLQLKNMHPFVKLCYKVKELRTPL